MDIVDKPFVTQEQKFEYWKESKAEIKSLRNQLAECQKDAARYKNVLRHIDKICNGLISSDFDGEIEIIKRVISQAMSEKG